MKNFPKTSLKVLLASAVFLTTFGIGIAALGSSVSAHAPNDNWAKNNCVVNTEGQVTAVDEAAFKKSYAATEPGIIKHKGPKTGIGNTGSEGEMHGHERTVPAPRCYIDRLYEIPNIDTILFSAGTVITVVGAWKFVIAVASNRGGGGGGKGGKLGALGIMLLGVISILSEQLLVPLIFLIWSLLTAALERLSPFVPFL